MFFLATLLGILLMTLFFAVLGTPLAEILPWKLRPAARAYLTPALGLAVAILLVTPWGWLGSGFAQAGVRLAALAVFGLTLLWVIRYRPGAMKAWPRLLAISAVCALPFTLQLLFSEAYNPFNDAFTYIVQSQWLQHHNMAGVLTPRIDEPALSQVRFTQATGTRASAQFLLGFEQAILGIRWAHQAYPIAICAAAAAGCLTVAFASQAGFRKPARWFAPLAACFCGLSLNGNTYGEINGFYPQATGLACGFAALWMFGLALRQRGPVRSWLPVAVAASASLYAYSEFFPLLAVSLGGGFAVAWVLAERKQRLPLTGRAVPFGVLLLLLISPEIPRAARAIISQSSAIVGTSVVWSPWEFAMHSAGFRTGAYEELHWLCGSDAAAIALCLLMLAGAAAQALRLGLGRSRVVALSPVLTFLALAIVLFVKFRYATPSPFPTGVGQSWNQFKLAGWSTLGLIGLLGSLSNGGTNGKGAVQAGIGAVWCVAILASAWTALAMARPRATPFAQAVGNKQSPMDGVLQFRAEVNRIVPVGAPLHLDLDTDQLKLRQFLAYLWMDRGVLADWSDDGYISTKMVLPTDAEIWAPDWIVTADAGRSSADVAALGALKLRRAVNLTIQLSGLEGTLDQEQLGQDWWRWVTHSAACHVKFHWHGSTNQHVPVHIRFGLIVRSKEPVTVEIVAGDGHILRTRQSDPGTELAWYDLVEPDGAELGADWSIRWTASAPPARLTPNDPREAAFSIHDLAVDAGP